MIYNILHLKTGGNGFALPDVIQKLVVTDLMQSPDNLFHMLSIMDPGIHEAELRERFDHVSTVSRVVAEKYFDAASYTVRRRCRHGDFFARPAGLLPAVLEITDAQCGLIPVMVPGFVLSDDDPAQALNRIMYDVAGGHPEAWSSFMRGYDPDRLASHGIYFTGGCPEKAVTIKASMWTDVPDRYEVTVRISRDRADRIGDYLSNREHLGEDDTVSETAVFPDGMQMDIKCCGVQDRDETAWTEAVLFEPNGAEAACSDVFDTFTGTWDIEHEGITYVANVVVDGG